jgi:hypothetical protein
MTLLGFRTILHKKCRSGKNSEGPAETSWTYAMSSKMKTNFKKSDISYETTYFQKNILKLSLGRFL